MGDMKRAIEIAKSNFVKMDDGSYVNPIRIGQIKDKLNREQAMAREFEDEAVLFVGRGYSLICAMCVRLREAVDAGLSNGCGVVGCGGIMAGKDFPHYEGPFSRESWKNHCVVCGATAVRGVRARGCSTWLGLCQEHRGAFHANGNQDGPAGAKGVTEVSS